MVLTILPAMSNNVFSLTCGGNQYAALGRRMGSPFFALGRAPGGGNDEAASDAAASTSAGGSTTGFGEAAAGANNVVDSDAPASTCAGCSELVLG